MFERNHWLGLALAGCLMTLACALAGAQDSPEPSLGLLTPHASLETPAQTRDKIQTAAAHPLPRHMEDPQIHSPIPVPGAHKQLSHPLLEGEAEAVVLPAHDGANLTVRVKVPHNKKVYDQFSAYPYPVKPPKIVTVIEPMSENPIEVKNTLISLGYATRTAAHKPYPAGGWRWQYAFQAALRHAGDGVPHFLFQMYPWATKMVDYIMPHIKAINLAEKQRLDRYNKMVQDHERNYAEIESEATRKGLFSHEFKMRGLGVGAVHLPAGTWWITGTHKTPGLTYYWYMPVTLLDGDDQTLYMTESNALVIQGGW